MVRDTIKGISIQTPKSLLSSFCPAESIIENNSFKNSDLFQYPSKKYVIPIKDDYKFQTISTNEKDNNKNNPFIIYVCDNVQKINFTNDNQTNQINQINNAQTQPFINPQINNKSIEIKEINNNYDEKNNNNNYLQTYANQIGKNFSQINQYNKINNIKNNNNIPKNKIKMEKISVKKIDENTNKKKNNRLKARSNKIGNDINNINNAIASGNKKGIKIKRITTDINTVKHKAKYKNLSGIKNINAKPRQTYNISQSNLPINNNTVRELNKSLEGQNNNNYRLSKTSDIISKKKQKTKNISNNNKIKLINRINLNKKENPFFNKNDNNN
jgi:hypothetical protein